MSFFAAREKAGKTQAEAAQYMGVTAGAISQWENGIAAPKIERLKKLAAFYNCTVDELLKEDSA